MIKDILKVNKRSATLILGVSLLFVGCQRELLPEGDENFGDGQIRFSVSNVGVKSSADEVVVSTGSLSLMSRDGKMTVPVTCEVNEGIDLGSVSAETKGALINTTGDYISLPDGNTFTVSAYKGSEAQFTKQTATNSGDYWTIDPPQYWPLSTKLTFFAFANTAATSVNVNADATAQTLTYAVPSAAAAHQDILLGFYEGNGGNKGIAEIRFDHPLTAVRFKKGEMTGVTGIKSITISGLASGGTVTMDAHGVIGDWTVAGTEEYKTEVTLSDGDNPLEVDEDTKLIGLDAARNYNGAFLLIPQTLSAHKVTVTVVLATESDDVTVSADIASGTWLAGKTNTYTLGYSATDPDLLPGKFSISATEYVQFSRGNLFCTDKGSDKYEFSFEEKQYYYRCRSGFTGDKAVLGGDDETTPQHTSGLFLWIPRTSGSATADWGAFKSYSSGISDDKVNDTLDFGGVFPGSDWTTLTSVQWNYLLDHHTYKFVTVMGVYGLAIAPDDYEGEISASYTTLEQWVVAEAAGIVFLPIYGYYNANGTSGYVVTSESCYWSSSPHASTANYAIALHFGDLKSTPLTPSMVVNERWRIYGQNVRLVQKFDWPEPSYGLTGQTYNDGGTL